MDIKNIWGIVKNRYRFSTKTQMRFELSFPTYLIGKCRFSTHTAYQIRTQKVSPSLQGIIFSDTIPLSWFTSSVLIPWNKIMDMTISDTALSIDGISSNPLSSQSNQPPPDFQYCALRLDDPQNMRIDFPWSEKFADYVTRNKLFDVNPMVQQAR